MSKCICGYEARLPGEQEALDKWGCAQAREIRQQPFNNLLVTMCERNTGSPTFEDPDNGDSFKENFMKKYEKPNPNKDGNKN